MGCYWHRAATRVSSCGARDNGCGDGKGGGGQAVQQRARFWCVLYTHASPVATCSCCCDSVQVWHVRDVSDAVSSRQLLARLDVGETVASLSICNAAAVSPSSASLDRPTCFAAGTAVGDVLLLAYVPSRKLRLAVIARVKWPWRVDPGTTLHRLPTPPSPPATTPSPCPPSGPCGGGGDRPGPAAAAPPAAAARVGLPGPCFVCWSDDALSVAVADVAGQYCDNNSNSVTGTAHGGSDSVDTSSASIRSSSVEYSSSLLSSTGLPAAEELPHPSGVLALYWACDPVVYLWDVQHGDVVALQRCGGGDGVQGPTVASAQVSPCAEFRRGPRHVSWSRGVAGNSVVTAVFDDGLPCQLDVADGCDGDCVAGQPLDVSPGTVHGVCACNGGCGPGGSSRKRGAHALRACVL